MQEFLTNVINAYLLCCFVYLTAGFIGYCTKQPAQAQAQVETVETVKSLPTVSLASLKIYKLRGSAVVHVEALPIAVPTSIKRYILRGKEVIHLAELEVIATLTT